MTPRYIARRGWARRLLAAGRRLGGALDPPGTEYRLTRWLFLRLLGLVYAIAFLVSARQAGPLIGDEGLLPARLYLDRAAASTAAPWLEVPTLLWISTSDGFLAGLAWLGFAGSLLLLAGYASGLHLLILWVLYSSFVNAGQVFYGYGWEILTLETGFLAVFLCPFGRGGWRHAAPPDRAVMWLLRWLLFRVIFGAGLIKLRGDPCWLDLTCLLHHYETQPIPNPLSPYLHQLPGLVHRAGVLHNHLVEVAVPLLIFGTVYLRRLAGLLIVAFQVLLIASGNLSWLNYLTIALCLPCFDHAWLRRLAPRPLKALLSREEEAARPPGRGRRLAVGALTVVVVLLSAAPAANMLSSRQVMNTSYDRLNLVNTYGAFGHVGKVRREVVLLGTLDEPGPGGAVWREYPFHCKPGDPSRRPCVVSPYHHRLDWQIWFAAMADYRSQPWLVHLVYKLLHADPGALSLLAEDPFEGRPPRRIRADLYEYGFAPPGEPGWWRRRRLGEYLPALSAGDPALRRVVEGFGWPLLPVPRQPPTALTPKAAGCPCGAG